MPGGRPPKGPELANRFQGSEDAKQRLRAILGTLSGQVSVADACTQLGGISESRFYQLRDEALQAALKELEPSWRGRPPKEVTPEQAEVAVLKEHLKEMKLAVEAAHIRTQVALVMPNLFKLPEGEDPLDPKVMQRRLEKKLRKARKRNSVRILGAKGG